MVLWSKKVGILCLADFGIVVYVYDILAICEAAVSAVGAWVFRMNASTGPPPLFFQL